MFSLEIGPLEGQHSDPLHSPTRENEKNVFSNETSVIFFVTETETKGKPLTQNDLHNHFS